MRRIYFILMIPVLAIVVGAVLLYARARAPEPLTITVEGKTIALKPGVNVRPEIYELAQNPEFVANSEWVFNDPYWDVMPKGADIPLELRQIILLEGHPGFPEGFEWSEVNGWEVPIFPALSGELEKGRMFTTEGLAFDFSLILPASWAEKVEMRQEANTVYFDYSRDPALKHPLFSIAALTADEWEAARAEVGAGSGLISVDEIVFVYNTALDNPYVGAEGDEFQRMAEEAREIIATFVAIPSASAAAEWRTYEFSSGVSLEYPAGWAPEPIKGPDDLQEVVFIGEDGMERIMVSLARKDRDFRFHLEPNEGGFRALWPLSVRSGEFDWTWYVWGQTLEGALDGSPSLTAEMYSPADELFIILSTVFVPLGLEQDAEAIGLGEVVRSRFAIFEHMVESVRIMP